jgi:hypothetical protein
MSCDRYTDAIVDHACGAAIAADAAAHLRSCAACRRMFDEQRQALQDLDRELETALAIEPSDRFVAETMARVERSSPRWRTVIWWSAPAAAAAAVLILVTLGALRFGERMPVDRREPRAPQTAAAVVPDRTPPPALPPTMAADHSPPAKVRARDTRTKVTVRDRGPRVEGEGMVRAAQSQAIARYLTLVRRGVLDASALATPDRAGAAPPSELVITPISVEPLTVPDGEDGSGVSVDRREPR